MLLKEENQPHSSGDKEGYRCEAQKNSPSTAESDVHCHSQRRRRVVQIRDAMKNRAGAYFSYVTARF